MSQNPLQNYFRQPKIYINLPTKGIYCKEGTIQGEPSNMPVFGMTGMDEIIVRTPDALMTGESTVRTLESCIPSIKDGWDISTLDADLLFSAIRIATYGNLMTVGHVCSKCNTDNDYDLDLNKVVDHFSHCVYNNRLVYGDLIILTRPLSYKQATDINLKTYELQQKLAQADSIENAEEQQSVVNELWKDFAKAQQTLLGMVVESVEMPGATVTERGYITEWLANCDNDTITAIKKHIDENKAAWSMPTFPVKCENCGAKTDISTDLDYSNFFVRA